MVWIAIGLILFTGLWVAFITAQGFWDARTWRQPRRSGLTFEQWVLFTRFAPPSVLVQKPHQDPLTPAPPRRSDIWAMLYQQWAQPRPDGPAKTPPPVTLAADPIQFAVAGAYAASLENADSRQRLAVVSFSRVIVFSIVATFL